MSICYSISLPTPGDARGGEPSLSFSGHSACAFAEQLQAALGDPAWFERWRALQPNPEDVDPGLSRIDPTATVTGQQSDLRINLFVTTSLPASVLKHRMQVLAGPHWELRDVR